MKTIIKEWKLKRFTVRVEALPDDDLDLSFDESGEVREQLESGTLVAFCVKTSVRLDGMELSSDYLGGCIYPSPAAFNDHIAAHGTGCGSYFKDMVQSAITDARNTLSDMQAIHIRT
jgi:hypothetical protein